jgi:hypothetical protein
MRNGDVALRFSVVFALVGFIIMAAGIYEIDRREKSSSATVTANLTGIEHRVQILSDQIRSDDHCASRLYAASDADGEAL